MLRRECNICAPAGIDVDTVLKSVLLLARKHEVRPKNILSSLKWSLCMRCTA
jgi:hypothetical protein